MSGTDQPAAAVLAPEVASAIESWVSYSIAGTDAATLAAVMPAVRAIVAAAVPDTPMAARRMLWALTPMAVWLYSHPRGLRRRNREPRQRRDMGFANQRQTQAGLA